MIYNLLIIVMKRLALLQLQKLKQLLLQMFCGFIINNLF